MLEFKSDVIKDVSSAKMSHSFATVKVPMKVPSLHLVPFYFCSWEAEDVACFFSSSQSRTIRMCVNRKLYILNEYDDLSC